MLTPVEMQNKALKTGLGYKKKETDDFLDEIFASYEQLFKENTELKEKLSVADERLQYYKDLEVTLQKTLVVAEKTAESTKTASLKKAAAIEKDATIKAQMTLSEAKKAADSVQNQTLVLVQQFENYRQQYKQILNAQMELLDSKAYSLPPYEPINIEIPSLEDTANTEDLSPVFEEAEQTLEENLEKESKEASAVDISLADTQRIFGDADQFAKPNFPEESKAVASDSSDEKASEDSFEFMDI
jgi:cell division initiation protein